MAKKRLGNAFKGRAAIRRRMRSRDLGYQGSARGLGPWGVRARQKLTVGGSVSDIYIRLGNHWRKAQRRLPERRDPPPEPPRRERGPRTLDSLLAGQRRKPFWK